MKTAFSAAAILVVALGCARAGAPASVEVEESFAIPAEAGKEVSHAPAVVFGPGGRRLLTATSRNEVVVFDAESRAILKRAVLPGPAESLSLDPLGRWAVWTGADGTVSSLDLESGKVVARVETPGARSAPSPDGALVAVFRGGEVQLRTLPGLELRRALPEREGAVTGVAWSADGRRLAVTTDQGGLSVVDVGGRPWTIERRHGDALYAAAFHPAGGTLAYGGKEKRIHLLDLDTGREELLAEAQPYWITCLGFSPDGALLAAGDESCDVWLFDVAARKMSFHGKHHEECWLTGVAWAPDSETFVFGCRPNDHLSKPTLHEPLVAAEAARAPAVAQKREALLRAIDGELAAAGGEKESLAAYRRALVGEAAPPSDAPGLAVAFTAASGTGGAPLTGATFALDEPGESVPELPEASPEIGRLEREHREALDREAERLRSAFRVNQWKARR